MQFVRGALESILHKCHAVDGKHVSNKGQYLEGMVDVLIGDPLIWKTFQMPELRDVFKERLHRGYFERETYKKSVQKSTLKEDNKFMVDHAVETFSANPEERFIHGCGETASNANQSKKATDMKKTLVCNRSELSVASLAKAQLVHQLFCFGFFVGGPEVTAWSQRMVDGLPWCDKLFEYTVPQTATELRDFSLAQWVLVLEGLVYTWQLAERTAEQTALLTEAKFNRTIDLTSDAATVNFSAENTPHKPTKPGKESKEPEGDGGGQEPFPSGSAGSASPKEALMVQLESGKAHLKIDRIVELGLDNRLLLGTLVNSQGTPSRVVVKCVVNADFAEEAHMHQAAVGLAREGVLPLLGWTTDRALISKLQLPRDEELLRLGGGILIMPQAQALKDTLQRPLGLLHRVLSQLCPTLLKLTRAGLFHNDLKWDNVVVWQERLYLIDFGLAAWEQDGLNRKGARGGEQTMQAPELGCPDYVGPVGEFQLVYTLASFLLDGFMFDMSRALGFTFRGGHTGEMFDFLTKLNCQPLSDPTRSALPDVWVHGLPLVCEMLAPMLNTTWQDRPRLKDAVGMLDGLYNEWVALQNQGEVAANKALAVAKLAAVHAAGKVKPSRRPLHNLNQAPATTTP